MVRNKRVRRGYDNTDIFGTSITWIILTIYSSHFDRIGNRDQALVQPHDWPFAIYPNLHGRPL